MSWGGGEQGDGERFGEDRKCRELGGRFGGFKHSSSTVHTAQRPEVAIGFGDPLFCGCGAVCALAMDSG